MPNAFKKEACYKLYNGTFRRAPDDEMISDFDNFGKEMSYMRTIIIKLRPNSNMDRRGEYV